jgi:putative membrane protein
MTRLFALLAALALAFPTYAQKDSKILRELAQANMAEVRAGKLGAQKATEDDVKRFGERMAEGHGEHLVAWRKIAKANKVDLPAGPDKKHQDALKKLEQAKKGPAFDRAYMAQMVKDHEETLKLHQNAAKNATDKDVRDAAQKAIPDVRQHLDTAKGIQSSLKSRH